MSSRGGDVAQLLPKCSKRRQTRAALFTLLSFSCGSVLRFHFNNGDFEDHWLPFRNQGGLAAWQFRQDRQLHPLHRSLDTPQGMATQRNLVCGEDQSECLLFAIAVEFTEGELIERQQQALFSRYFDFDRASVRIARPTFGCFCAHGFVRVDDYDDGKV